MELGKRVMRKADIYLEVHHKRGLVCGKSHDDIPAGQYGERL